MKKTVVALALVGLIAVPAFAEKSLSASSTAVGFSSASVAQRATGYATGFETAEGFVVGPIDTQNGWASFNSTLPAVSAANPATGAQHFRLAQDTALPTGTAIGSATPLYGPFSSGENVVISVDVNISGTGGADYFVEPADSTSGTINTRVRFLYADADGDLVPGDILVFDDDGAGGFVYTVTGAEYVVGQYQNLTIDMTLGGQINYYYGGSLIYTDANGIPGVATTHDTVALYEDNWNIGDVGDFDNLSITPEPTSLALLTLGGLALLRRRR